MGRSILGLLSAFVPMAGLSRGGEVSKAEAACNMPADPNVCHMDLMGDDELDGDELDGDAVLGDAVLGMALVGKAHRKKHGGGKPKWRHNLAPGVPNPGYGVFPVPLTPQSNDGVFDATHANITFSTIVQVPFRGERLLTRVARAGAAGSNCFAQNGVYIGIRPQMGVLGNLNLENYSATAFGVRLVMQPAEQGAQVQVFAFVNPALTGTDTLALSIEILGRIAA
jgi:hypothetical protein